MHKGVIYALLAAGLFGASTPFAKTLIGQTEPVMLAGLLYLGTGLGLLIWFVFRNRVIEQKENANMTWPDAPWLAGAILAGGIAGPVLLMFGLRWTPASSASLLLNLEGVLTSFLAWFVFKENFDRRIFIGMMLIVVAGVLLSWDQTSEMSVPWGALAIVAACLCWAIDNNLTRKVSASDAVQIAGIKGLVAGTVNLSIAWYLGHVMPQIVVIAKAGIIGFTGYGLSLVLFVLALRELGSARTGAYFSAAPFVGAAISLVMLGDSPNIIFWVATALMGAGIWLHLTEIHEHEHEEMSHTHQHTHDIHHQHDHDFDWNGVEPHVHFHQHEPLKHTHPHYPDIHHRHDHEEPK